MNNHRTHRRRWSSAAIVLASLSAVALLFSALFDESGESYRIVLVPFLLATTFLMAARSQVSEQILDRVTMDGYDEGFAAGCRAMSRAGLADRSVPLTLLRTPQQLPEQDDLASGTDGIG